MRKRSQGTGCQKVLDPRFACTLREVASSWPLLGLDQEEDERAGPAALWGGKPTGLGSGGVPCGVVYREE